MVATDRRAEIGRRLEAQRLSLNMSQAALARRAGIPRRAVIYLEKGTRRMDVLEFAALNRALRVSNNYLLTGDW